MSSTPPNLGGSAHPGAKVPNKTKEPEFWAAAQRALNQYARETQSVRRRPPNFMGNVQSAPRAKQLQLRRTRMASTE